MKFDEGELKNLLNATKSMVYEDSIMNELTDKVKNNLISLNKLTNEINKQKKYLIYEIGYNLLKDNPHNTKNIIEDTINTSGISRETFYYYFKMPTSFIYEIIMYKRKFFKERLNKIIPKNGSIHKEDLKMFISDFIRYKDLYDCLDEVYIFYIKTITSKNIKSINFYSGIGYMIFNNIATDMRKENCNERTITGYLKTLSFIWHNNDVSSDELCIEDKNDTIRIMINELINYIYR